MLRVECWRHLTLVAVPHGGHGDDHQLVVVDERELGEHDALVHDVVVAGVNRQTDHYDRLAEQALVDYIVEG